MLLELNRLICLKNFLILFSLLIIFTGCTGKNAITNTEEYIIAELVIDNRAEAVMRSFYFAYPEKISSVEFYNDDWTFILNDTRFFYSDGRILPEDKLEQASNYGALLIWNNYTAELPWEITTEPRRTSRPWAMFRGPRSNYLYEALWGISNQREADQKQARIIFLGRRLTIHSDLRERFNRIEKIILEEAKTDPEVQKWIDSLGTVEAYTWRSVASSGSRSFHSYGVAVDLLPRNLGGLQTYWLWTSQHNPNWMNVPYSERYHPPDIVIKTFESFGFIWGGKWRQYFDTMHFEYRPEVFILSDVPMSNFYLWD